MAVKEDVAGIVRYEIDLSLLKATQHYATDEGGIRDHRAFSRQSRVGTGPRLFATSRLGNTPQTHAAATQPERLASETQVAISPRKVRLQQQSCVLDRSVPVQWAGRA